MAEDVPVLGRWLTFFAERAEHPASSLMLAATEALALHWATGQSSVEDLNLGAILGWIDPPPGQSGASAAAAAEDPVRCPPAGPATDPTFDSEVIERRISAVRTARFTGQGYDHAKAALTDALCHPARAHLDADVARSRTAARPPEGGHVRARWDADKDAFTWHARHLRDGGPPQPRRDGAVSAARRLANIERVQQMVAARRVRRPADHGGAPAGRQLQKGPEAVQLLALDGKIFIWDAGSNDADLADTAAMMATLDLVITTDTCIAHLAGAMGKTVWILLPHLATGVGWKRPRRRRGIRRRGWFGRHLRATGMN